MQPTQGPKSPTSSPMGNAGLLHFRSEELGENRMLPLTFPGGHRQSESRYGTSKEKLISILADVLDLIDDDDFSRRSS